MLCTHCKKNQATIFYKSLINGEATEIYLCPDCAESMGFGPERPSDEMIVNELLGSILPRTARSREVKVCGLCGQRIDEFSRSGKAGCSECYNVFREELYPSIVNLHGSAEHKGRENPKTGEVKALKAELRKAVEGEDYEKAAALRDKIRELEKEA